MLEFLSALRRPVGENCLLKTKEDCIEYFNAILYIKEDIDNENKKINWERVWYALWRGMAWAIVVSFVLLLFVYVDKLFDTLEIVGRWRINVGTILLWTWRDLDVSFLPRIWFMATFGLCLAFGMGIEKKIPPFTIFDCAKIYKEYSRRGYIGDNRLGNCYVLNAFRARRPEAVEKYSITRNEAQAYMLLADAMLISTSKTYSVGSDEMVDHRKDDYSEVSQRYYKEFDSGYWSSCSYIPSEIIDLLNKKYNTESIPLSVDEYLFCGINFKFL